MKIFDKLRKKKDNGIDLRKTEIERLSKIIIFCEDNSDDLIRKKMKHGISNKIIEIVSRNEHIGNKLQEITATLSREIRTLNDLAIRRRKKLNDMNDKVFDKQERHKNNRWVSDETENIILKFNDLEEVFKNMDDFTELLLKINVDDNVMPDIIRNYEKLSGEGVFKILNITQ
ncbi:MAG: hypothetical protein KC589_07250 [Nanoarchaeota archaeon]|nr:hypothetical protein [Nanoarchaeota archaeon]